MKHPDFHNQAILQNIFLLENIQGGIVYSDFDPPFYLRYVTEGMEHLSGYSKEELLTMKQMDLVYEEDIETLAADVGSQLSKGDTFDVEYRLKRKDGSHVYVLDRAKAVPHEDGRTYIHCLLTDITDLKHMEQALRLSEEKYKIAMQQSGYAILEYSPKTGRLETSENYSQIFNGMPAEKTLEGFAHKNVVEGSADVLLSLFTAAVSKKRNVSIEIQVQTKCGRHAWCSLHLTPLLNAFSEVYAVVGCLQNIDARKRRFEELTELSQKDGLTNTYNRVTMEAFVNQYLSTPRDTGHCALCVLDIDYFKSINDTMGHDAGDEVLVGLVKHIRSMLHPGDLFGRLGGDEFLIFLPKADPMEAIVQFANRIVESVRNNFRPRNIPITISLGLAFCGTDCHCFQGLYKNADVALYEVKMNGRNGYSVFTEQQPIEETRAD